MNDIHDLHLTSWSKRLNLIHPVYYISVLTPYFHSDNRNLLNLIAHFSDLYASDLGSNKLIKL